MTFPSRKSQRDEKVVHAAAQLFAHPGYHGTIARQIARLDDISENTLFRYFERKEASSGLLSDPGSVHWNCAAICRRSG